MSNEIGKFTYRVARKLALPESQNWPRETKLQSTICEA